MNPPKKTRIGAYAIILREQEILLCRLSEAVPSLRGKWIIPGGGIEFGEAPMQTMIREVHEETGYEVSSLGLIDVHSCVINTLEKTQQNIRILYRAKIIGGDLQREVSGSTDLAQWWSLDDLPPLMDLGEHAVALAKALPVEA